MSFKRIAVVEMTSLVRFDDSSLVLRVENVDNVRLGNSILCGASNVLIRSTSG